MLPAFFENVFFPKCFGSRPHSQKMSETALGLVTENGRKNPESQNFDEVFFSISAELGTGGLKAWA